MANIADVSVRWRRWIYRAVIRELVLWGSMLSLFINGLLMVGLLAASAWEGIVACLTFAHIVPPPPGFSSADKAAIALGLKAVELVLLAPLGYVFVSALATFVQALVEQKDDDWTGAFRVIVGVKSLATSLLISIVAVDFIGKILEGQTLETAGSLIQGFNFILLIIYLLVLERG